MKKIFVIIFASMFLFACNSSDNQAEVSVGLANPASEYCVSQNGKSEIRKNEDGSEYGVCIFADGTEIEEWEFYRKSQTTSTGATE